MSSSASELQPVPVAERIHALDIVRGFALLGIFLMNIEWFLRPITDLGSGVDLTLTGIDQAASWFVYTFVQSKFWTLFSLLFGMGFAVMLARAESSDRSFALPYVRRIICLFVFGVAHYVLIWSGDILHNYAITALALLLIATRNWKAWAAILGSVIGSGILLRSDAVTTTAVFLGVVALLMFVLNRGSVDRYYRFGVAMYLLPLLLGLGYVGAVTVFPGLEKPATPTELQERSARRADHEAERREELRMLSHASYAESVEHRARQFSEAAPEAAGLSFSALPLFLIGFWFVRAGIIGRIGENLDVFRKLARWALPLGLAVTLFSVQMHSSFPPGTGRTPSYVVARLLFDMAALPLCLGYFAALICLLQTRRGMLVLAPLRHAGRMALTNYLGASLIASLVFSGYGFGYHSSVSRAGQLLFVVVVFTLQALLSAWWLERYQYGPMEWLWRAVTYWQLPSMRAQVPAKRTSDPAAPLNV